MSDHAAETAARAVARWRIVDELARRGQKASFHFVNVAENHAWRREIASEAR